MNNKSQVVLVHEESELGGSHPWVHVPALRSCVTLTKTLNLSEAVVLSVRLEGYTHIANLQ